MVFFIDMHIKHVTGKITQIIIPIVDPSNPKTTSMLGINIPIIKDTPTINKVKSLKRFSGIKFDDPS